MTPEPEDKQAGWVPVEGGREVPCLVSGQALLHLPPLFASVDYHMWSTKGTMESKSAWMRLRHGGGQVTEDGQEQGGGMGVGHFRLEEGEGLME